MKIGTPRKGRERHCPTCNYLCDGQTGVGNDSTPSAGDLSVCFKCGEISIFDDSELGLRKPTDAEHAEALTYPEIIRVRHVISQRPN